MKKHIKNVFHYYQPYQTLYTVTGEEICHYPCQGYLKVNETKPRGIRISVFDFSFPKIIYCIFPTYGSIVKRNICSEIVQQLVSIKFQN